jgi:hypothetical protein
VAADRKEVSDENKRNESNHNDLYHWVYVAIPVVFAGFVNFIFLRPEHHLLSFIMFSAWINLVVVYQLYKSKYTNNIIALSVILVFASSIVVAAIVGPVHLPDTETVGSIVPGNLPTPPNGCGTAPAGHLLVLFGTNGYVLSPQEDKGVPIEMGTPPNLCDVITISRDKLSNAVDISANIYDPSGRLIAKIYNNEYHSIVGDASYIKRGSLTSLTVMGRDTWLGLYTTNYELLHLDYVNQTAIKLRGLFSCPGTASVSFDDNGVITTGNSRVTLSGICMMVSRPGIHID